MIFHMKTTLIIPDDLMRDLKKQAAEAGRTLSDLVADTLRRGMTEPKPPRRLKKLPSFDCGEIRVNIADRDQLFRIMEGR